MILKNVTVETKLSKAVLRTLPNRQAKREKSRVAIQQGQALLIVEIAEIFRFEADSNYCRMYMKNGRKIILSKSMGTVIGSIPDEGFIRVHQSHCLRLSSISEVHSNHVILATGETIPLSRSRKAEVRERIKAESLCL